MFYGKDILVKTVVHALQHLVVFRIARRHREKLLYSCDALHVHVLRYFNRICAPRRNHLASRTHEEAIHAVAVDNGSIAKEPCQCISLAGIHTATYFYCNDRRLACLEENYHKLESLEYRLKTWLQIRSAVWQ